MSSLPDVRYTGVKVHLDRERHLKFDLNAFAEIEDRYGSLEEGLNKMQSGSIKAVRTLLWAGLVHEDELLTEKQVGAMIHMGNLESITLQITEAMGKSLPEPKVEEENSKNE